MKTSTRTPDHYARLIILIVAISSYTGVLLASAMA